MLRGEETYRDALVKFFDAAVSRAGEGGAAPGSAAIPPAK